MGTRKQATVAGVIGAGLIYALAAGCLAPAPVL